MQITPWLPETENTCESICFTLGMPETSCRQWWSIQKASLICSVSRDGPYSCLIPSGWSCAISKHVCGARCPTSLCEQALGAGWDVCSKGGDSIQAGSHQRHSNSTNSHKQLQKQTVAIPTAALKASWKKNKRLLHALWKPTRSFGKVISPQKKVFVCIGYLLYCVLL